MAFDAAKRNGRFGRIQYQRGKEQQQRKETSIPLHKNSGMGLKVGSKVIPASFLKVEERKTLVGAKYRRERDR